MTIRVEIAGLDELRRQFSNMDQAFNIAVGDAIEDTIHDIRNGVIEKIQRGPASGRVYEKYSPRRTHQASAPGQPPMTDTGTLVRSIYFDLQPLSATVGSRLVYAHYLEYGTRRMAARPVWRQEVKRATAKLRGRIEANLRAAIR